MALSVAGKGFLMGSGDPTDTILRSQGAHTSYTGDVTMTAAEVTNGILHYTGSGHALTMPLATDLDAYLVNSQVNHSFDFYVIATTGTATVTTNTGWTTSQGTLTVLSTISGHFRARKTAAGAWTLYRIS